ncbi:MAG: M20/M25/M40 family metallo-hydrolase [Caldilineaceae bacterium]|nr:M20/M25/M40 family metallo-hydrolase [Caldilineaceae bacterium]
MSLAQQAATWLSRLVQIPSVTSVQAGPRAGEPGEQRIADAIAAWFQQLGGRVEIDIVEPGRPNVYGLWPGETDTWAAVDAHVDTVGVEQMTGEPFSGEISQGRVWGRGAVDTKASLGVILALLEQMQATGQRPKPGLLIGATVDEEFGATGAPAFASWIAQQPFSVAQMVVAEPTLCVPVIGHRGVARFELAFIGESAHSSQPDKGRNAIVGAAKTVVSYANEHQRLQTLAPTMLGTPTLTSTLIHGGTGNNVVPDRCTLFIDRRLVDGEEAGEVIDRLYAIAQDEAKLPVELTRQLEINAFLQPPDSPFVQKMAAWSASTPYVAPYGTNAWAYGNLPCETVVIGPGSIDQAHSTREWVEVAELEKIGQIYAQWWGSTLP